MSKKIDVKDTDHTPKSIVDWRIIAIFGIVFITILIIVGATYSIETSSIKDEIASKLDNNSDNEAPPTEIEEEVAEKKPEDTIEDEIVQIEREPAFEGASFSEELTRIDDQPAYIASPLVTNSEELPPIIIYSHGSITLVSDKMNTPFMDDMRLYGDYFADKNYIFAASNQHGENWGNDASIQDTENLITYINQKYPTNGDIYMIGYSMGGLPTWNYMFKHPKMITKTALLAPTSYSSNYTKENFDSLKDTDVKIWHGTADVNIDISMSKGLVRRANLFGKDIELVSLEGKTHWDVDTELQDEIFEFFSE